MSFLSKYFLKIIIPTGIVIFVIILSFVIIIPDPDPAQTACIDNNWGWDEKRRLCIYMSEGICNSLNGKFEECEGNVFLWGGELPTMECHRVCFFEKIYQP